MHLNIIRKEKTNEYYDVASSFMEVFNEKGNSITCSESIIDLKRRNNVNIILLPKNGFHASNLNEIFCKDIVQYISKNKNSKDTIFMLGYRKNGGINYNFYELDIDCFFRFKGVSGSQEMLITRFKEFKERENFVISAKKDLDINFETAETSLSKSVIRNELCDKNIKINNNSLKLLLLT